MKFRPGVVPQWPSRRGLMCSCVSGSSQQRIVEEIDLADGEVVGGAPPRIDQAALFLGQGICHHDLRSHCSDCGKARHKSRAPVKRHDLLDRRPVRAHRHAGRRRHHLFYGSRRPLCLCAAGVGAVLTQHRTDPRLGPKMLERLRDGRGARGDAARARRRAIRTSAGASSRRSRPTGRPRSSTAARSPRSPRAGSAATAWRSATSCAPPTWSTRWSRASRRTRPRPWPSGWCAPSRPGWRRAAS